MSRIILQNMVPGSNIAVGPVDRWGQEVLRQGQANDDGTWSCEAPDDWLCESVEVRVRLPGRLPYSSRHTMPTYPCRDITITVMQVVDRIYVPQFTEEARERLRALPDIRDVLTANCIRDMLAEGDEAFLRAVAMIQDRVPISIPFATCHQPDRPFMVEFFAYETIGSAIIGNGVMNAEF